MKDTGSPFSAGMLIYEVGRLIRRNLDRLSKADGFNLGQWRAMWRISLYPGITQAALAEMLELQPIALGRILDRLEESAMVERRPHPTDRRAVQLFLMPDAAPVLNLIRAAGKKTNDIAMEGMSPQEQEQLIALLQRLMANLSAADKPGTGNKSNNDIKAAAGGP